MTTTTTTATLEIVCPAWCTVGGDKHLAELGNWEVACLHTSDCATFPTIDSDADSGDIYLSHFTEPDGSQTTSKFGMLLIEVGGDSYTIDQAEAVAQHILGLVRAARA